MDFHSSQDRLGIEQNEELGWESLRAELKTGSEASETEFIELDIEDLIAQAKARKQA